MSAAVVCPAQGCERLSGLPYAGADTEMDHYLDCEAAEGRGTVASGRSRCRANRLATSHLQLIAKCRRRLPRFDDKIASMYVPSMTVRETQDLLADFYGLDVSPDLSAP